MKPSNLTDQPQVGVLVVGNNPANVNTLYSNIVSSRGSKLVADFAFDLKNITSRIMKQRPASIIIDDTLSQKQIDWLIWKIRKNNKLRDIAIQNGEPKQISGRQELYERIVNMYI